MGWIEDGVGSCNVLGGAGCGGRGKFDVLVPLVEDHPVLLRHKGPHKMCTANVCYLCAANKGNPKL